MERNHFRSSILGGIHRFRANADIIPQSGAILPTPMILFLDVDLSGTTSLLSRISVVTFIAAYLLITPPMRSSICYSNR